MSSSSGPFPHVFPLLRLSIVAKHVGFIVFPARRPSGVGTVVRFLHKVAVAIHRIFHLFAGPCARAARLDVLAAVSCASLSREADPFWLHTACSPLTQEQERASQIAYSGSGPRDRDQLGTTMVEAVWQEISRDLMPGGWVQIRPGAWSGFLAPPFSSLSFWMSVSLPKGFALELCRIAIAFQTAMPGLSAELGGNDAECGPHKKRAEDHSRTAAGVDPWQGSPRQPSTPPSPRSPLFRTSSVERSASMPLPHFPFLLALHPVSPFDPVAGWGPGESFEIFMLPRFIGPFKTITPRLRILVVLSAVFRSFRPRGPLLAPHKEHHFPRRSSSSDPKVYLLLNPICASPLSPRACSCPVLPLSP